ncbi:MAG: BamA/TamA family outer membrane protein [Gemmatimonadaceae bacterium]|nr:BamA/TamA family outer membrane protein [Gemmatimonadaceae bacterium]
MSAFRRLPRLLLAASLLVATPFVAHAGAQSPPVDPRDSMDVASLTFDGAKNVSATDLKTVLFTRTSSCRLVLFAPICKLTPNLLFTDRRRTTRKALGEDITALRVYYWRRGYREAQVDTVLAPVKRGMAVTFRIVEGEPTRVGAFTVTQRAPVLSRRELDDAVALQEGDPLSLVALDSTLARLKVAVWNHGYGDVRIDPIMPAPDASHVVPLTIDIDPRWLTRVGTVQFQGNSVLSDATLRRALLLRPGALYTRDAVLESQRRLFQSPAINRALVVTPAAGDSVKQISIAVTESPPRHASVTLGFNTIEFGQAAVELRHNVLGAGRWLSLRAAAGNLLGEQLNGRAVFRQVIPEDTPDASVFLSPTYQGSLTLTQPWIAGARTSASVTVFGGRRSLPGVVVDEDAGVTLGLVHELGPRLPVGINYRLESTRVRGGAVYFCAGYGICDDATVTALSTRQRLAPVGLSAWIDRADDLEAPTRGYTAVIDAEHASSATGSTFSHERVAGDGSYYRAFGRSDPDEDRFPKVLALHGRAGWVQPHGILHPRARFYAGGMQSVRGFAENELGPQVLEVRRASLIAAGCTDATIASGSCDPSGIPSSEFFTRPTGGSSVVEGSAELRLPLGSRLGTVVFLDGAYVGTAGLDVAARGRGAITPGAGLRYRSPLGVLRLDFGLRPVGAQSLPVVAAITDANGAQHIVRLATEKSYSPIEPDPGTLRSIARRLVVHFAMGQAF